MENKTPDQQICQEVCYKCDFLKRRTAGFPFFLTPKKVPGTTYNRSIQLLAEYYQYSNSPVAEVGIHFLTFSTSLQKNVSCGSSSN